MLDKETRKFFINVIELFVKNHCGKGYRPYYSDIEAFVDEFQPPLPRLMTVDSFDEFQLWLNKKYPLLHMIPNMGVRPLSEEFLNEKDSEPEVPDKLPIACASDTTLKQLVDSQIVNPTTRTKAILSARSVSISEGDRWYLQELLHRIGADHFIPNEGEFKGATPIYNAERLANGELNTDGPSRTAPKKAATKPVEESDMDVRIGRKVKGDNYAYACNEVPPVPKKKQAARIVHGGPDPQTVAEKVAPITKVKRTWNLSNENEYPPPGLIEFVCCHLLKGTPYTYKFQCEALRDKGVESVRFKGNKQQYRVRGFWCTASGRRDD